MLRLQKLVGHQQQQQQQQQANARCPLKGLLGQPTNNNIAHKAKTWRTLLLGLSCQEEDEEEKEDGTGALTSANMILSPTGQPESVPGTRYIGMRRAPAT